eukprot:scaffold108087_cov93-Phaeocystis_antarctica.AAC.1
MERSNHIAYATKKSWKASAKRTCQDGQCVSNTTSHGEGSQLSGSGYIVSTNDGLKPARAARTE